MKTIDDKVKNHFEVCKKLNDTYAVKNSMYGDSFVKSIEEWGYSAAGVRISDKYNRIVGLLKNNNSDNKTDESIEDTLLDLANYCIMLYMYINKYKK